MRFVLSCLYFFVATKLTYLHRIAVIFYCMGTLDILNSLESQTKEHERETWRDWLWEQQICSSTTHFTLVCFRRVMIYLQPVHTVQDSDPVPT